MATYSQNGEDVIIQEYFKSYVGTFLSLGENDGKTLSNVKALHDLGWSGVCVEPCKTSFTKLLENQPSSINMNVAIGPIPGKVTFWESGQHLGPDDYGLLSTIKKSSLTRWKGTKFLETECEVITFDMLLNDSPIKKFDLISIDCEDMDFEILTQIDLTMTGCNMLVIETNSIDDKKYMRYCSKFGMKVLYKNRENIIFVSTPQ